MSKRIELSHVSGDGRARMVDVGGKHVTERTARAEAVVRLGARVIKQLKATGGGRKGNPVETARIAGIMAAKRTAELIPLCHSIPLDVVDIQVTFGKAALRIESMVRAHHVTGVEMEALTAVAVAALTIYDMCKAADKGIVIERVRLLEKTGGKSCEWLRAVKETSVPYFASRPLSPAFCRLERSGKLKGGTDSTLIVSDDRERNVS